MVCSVMACRSEGAELQGSGDTWLVIAIYDLAEYCNVAVIQR